MIRVLLVLFAVAVFLGVAFAFIDQNVFRWEAGAFAALAASFLPFADVAFPQRRPPA